MMSFVDPDLEWAYMDSSVGDFDFDGASQV
jgi:hypothetical protein